MIRALLELIGLPPWMARPALRAALWHAVFVAAVTVVKSGTNALYLARADPKLLPLLYVAVALVVGLSTSGLARLLARKTPAQVLSFGILGAAGALVLAILAVAAGMPGAPATLYVVGEASATSGSVLFWARVMDAFSPRDQKRVVGVVGAGGMLGATFGGLFMRLVAQDLGVIGPMLGAALSFAVALPLLRGIRTRSRQRTHVERSNLMPGLRYLAGERYPMTVALLVVLLAATGAATDFVFRTASAHARSEAEMAALFGLLNAVVGAAVVVFQLSLTSRLLTRLGVFAFVALVPTLLVAASAMHVLLPSSFVVLMVMKGVEMAGAFSLNQAAVALLYNPMPAELRSQLRTLIDGAVKKSGAALAGFVLAGLAVIAPHFVDAGLVALLAGTTLLLLPMLRTRYLDALHEKLGQRRAANRGGAIDPTDRVTNDALRAALCSVDPDRVLAALDALGRDAPLHTAELSLLLKNPDERVRARALAHVPDAHDAQLAERLLTIARADGARRPRAEAVRALARVARPDELALALPFLDDEEPGVVVAAIEVLLLRGADARAQARLDELVSELSARSSAWRREVARLLGVLGEPRYDAALATLLDDDDVSVRLLAIDAAGRERHKPHLGRLVECLGDRRTRAAAVDALAAYGDAAVEELRVALDDQRRPVGTRIHVPRVLSRIGTTSAARALLFSNPRDDAYLQQRIATSLVQTVQRDGRVELDRARTDDAIRRRLGAAQFYAEAAADLEADERAELSLLRRAIHDRGKQNQGIAIELLGLHRGLERMSAVRRGLDASTASSSHARHDAIELLDAALTGDPLRAEILALLEPPPRARRRGTALVRSKQLMRSKDPLLRAIAQRTVAVIKARSPQPVEASGAHALELEGEDMPHATVERLFLLEHVDLFEGLATDDLAAIATIASEHALPAGAVLYREGEQGDSLFVIVEGEVELTRKGRAVLTLHEGESAGQVSFLDRGPRPVTARVSDQTPARFLVVEREVFLDLMSDRPGLMHAFFGVLAARLRSLIEREGGPREM